jgi:outer membrane protein assembly factor BamB
VDGDLYEFGLPAMGSGFDGVVSLAVSAGNGPNPLNWATSHWRQITIFPQEIFALAADATQAASAAGIEVGVRRGGGTVSVARYRTNRWGFRLPAPYSLADDFVELSGSASLTRLRVRLRPDSVQGMIAESVRLAYWQDGRWQPVETAIDNRTGTLSTRAAAPGLWAVIGQRRVLWQVFEPNGYYSAAVGDFAGNGKLQLLMPSNGRWGDGACGLIDGEGQVTFQQRDRLPARGMRFSSPNAVDINGDGWPEIIASSEDGNIWCLDHTGKVLWNYAAGGYCWTPVAVGDINGDGQPEIAAGCDDHFLYALDRSGHLLWKHEFGGKVDTPVVMVDVDRDGMLEVLAGSEQGEVAALKGDGTPLWTYHASAGATGITAADLDGDGHVESAVSLRDGHLLLLDDTGKRRWQYYWEPREPDQAGLWQSVAGDINGDGQRELVLGTEDGHGLALSAEGKLLWSVDIEQRAPGCPTLLDLNGDGKYEIIMTSVARAIWALDGSGKTIWSFRQRDGGGFYYTVAADLNGDGRVELFAVTPGGDYCLRTDLRCKKYEVLWGLQRGDARRSGVR